MNLRDRIRFMAETEGAGGGDSAAAAAAAKPGAEGGDGGGKLATSWRETLPEDLRADKRFEKFGDIGALAKSFVELDTWRGKAIVPPGKDATPEERAKFYERLGRPKDAKGYKIDFGEGVEIKDQAAFEQYLAVFHAAGLTDAQAGELARFEAGRVKALHEKRKADLAALDQEWGDKKAANAEKVKRVRMALGMKAEDVQALGAEIGSTAAVVRLLLKLSDHLVEDTSVGDKHRDTGGETPEAIQKQIDELQTSKDYLNKDPATHAKVRALYKKLFPSQQAAA